MKLEKVLCPVCGSHILAGIPLGQSIVCVSITSGKPDDFGAAYKSSSRCTSCSKMFACYTKNDDQE
jgi:DNA-directed RNA polymerase subunit RPC12/RpoP